MTTPGSDLAGLAVRLGQPLRPRLAEARAAVEGCSLGEQAWLRLFERGLVPAELHRASDRRFAVVDTERGPSALVRHEPELNPAPPSVAAAVTLGADAAAALEAERHARTLRTRLVRWGAQPAQRVDWIVVTHRIPYTFHQGTALHCAMHSVGYAVEGLDEVALAIPAALPPFVQDTIRSDARWRLAAARLLEVPGAYGAPRELVGTPFAELDNPFTEALALWSLGYVADHLREDDSPELQLVTAMIDAPPNRIDQLRGRTSPG